MKNRIKIGFVPLCMASFDAVLDVADVKAQEMPDMEAPAYLQDLLQELKKYGDVVAAPVTGDEPSAQKAADFFREHKIDVLVIHEFAFTLASTFMALVRGLQVPIVFWNAQMTAGIDESCANFGTFMANNSVSSIPHSTNVLVQQGVGFTVVTGQPGDARTARRFQIIFRAIGAKRALAEAHIGCIGYVYPGMHTISVNETTFMQQFGVAINHINPAAVRSYYNRVEDEEAKAILASLPYASKGLGGEELLRSAKYYCALKRMALEQHLDAYAILCGLLILEEDMGVAPCLGLSLLSQEGIYSSCECDVPAATALLIADCLAGNAHFTEFYMMDMQRETVLMAHCGYGSVALADPQKEIRLVPQPCFPGPRGNGAALEYITKPGELTLLSITAVQNGYKLVSVRMLAQDVAACRAGCPQIVAKFSGISLDEGVERYCKAGGSHHMVVCYGDIGDELDMLCQMLHIGYERIC